MSRIGWTGSAALSPEILSKVVEGWECPAASAEGDVVYRIEVRIRDGGLEWFRPDVTGCYEAQEADLMQIEAELERLSEKYLP
ncbi:hypothetical protein FRD01_21260 [Microvenator marinus]|uniref:Uncharacterized protein n=1 Tax=Microvenator marinus TaxID=2600177 RepID=A0A5B8XX13_9DELT|nr:hypothetical protein [Microvenator marinus]QED29721.1 hypothetical protein FRD01_21260 [Microvenator marinus]